MRITVYPIGKVRVTAPHHIPNFLVNRFVSKKQVWIERKLEYFKKHPAKIGNSLLRTRNRSQFKENKAKALELVTARLEHFNKFYNYKYGKVIIRNQKSRWGSCSRKGNLSFNYKIIYLDPSVSDYIVVHELCHLKEFNHSKNFWNLVGERIEDYKEIRKKLKLV